MDAMLTRGLTKAIDFVNKVRWRFRHEEGVYKCFLDAVNIYRKGLLDMKGARAQVAPLFEKHPDLLDEFFIFAVKRVTPSYTYSQTKPNQEDDHALNDTLEMCKNLNDGTFSSEGRIKSKDERVRDAIYEDYRFEMDMLLASETSATEAAEKLLNEINGGYNSEHPIRIEEHLSAMNLRCIEKLYGDEGIELVEVLKENPRDALPVIVPRLRQKLEELKECSNLIFLQQTILKSQAIH